VVGGESGPGARPMQPQWAGSLIAGCQTVGVPVFVKQLGTAWARAHGQPGKAGDPAGWPADLRVRQFPATGPAAR
ncbi:DUF5131 family protein, partial [Frankia sp. Cas4]|uniref:DUF5131 family protein n=1 Tax=Frankia sp. Cas4 TaxID=3073927 RepID=UPI002AD48CD7